jgi:hypothetical protein
MKNLFKLFVPMTAAAIALVSCVEENPFKAPEVPALQITVKAQADEAQPADPDTKTYVDVTDDPNHDGKYLYSIYWGTGEYMKIGVYDGTATTFGNSTDDTADDWNGDAEAFFNFSITPANAASSYTYYGMYPASAAVKSSNTNPASYKVNLPTTQNATAGTYDPAAYILIAKPEGEKTATSADWTAQFRRATALNKITLKNIPNGVSIKRVKITASEGKYLAGGRHFDLTASTAEGQNGDIYSGGGRTESVEVKYETALSGTGSGTWSADVWFTSWGVDLEAGNTLEIVAYSTDKKSYTKTISLTGSQKISFTEGKVNTLGANMSGITPVDVTEMEDGDYLILAKNGDNYYAVQAATSGNHIASQNYSGSLVSYTGDADLVWTVTKVGSSYTIENDSKYIGYKNSSNEAFWLEADSNWTETNYLLDIVWDTDCYHVTLNSDSNRKFSRNGSSDYFAFYTSDQQKDLLFVPATVDNRTKVTLSFDEESLGYDTSDYNTCTGQTATATPSVSAITSNISYAITSDDDDVISSLNTSSGAVSLTGNTGTATITASFAGDEDYRPAEASYTITVSEASGPQYEKVTSLANVTAGEYIIVNAGYYLPNAIATSAGPSKVAVTISGNKVQNVTEAMTWTFSGSVTGMTIKSTIEGNYYLLVSGNGNNNLRVNTTSDHTWTISDYSGTSGAFSLKDNSQNRYCATYSAGSDWRSYNTYNAGNYGDGGRVYLYKLASGPSVTWNLESIAITTAPTKTTYTAGETFDPAGMVVTGHFVDADDATNTKDEVVTGYTFTPDGALATSDTQVTITYQGKSADQAITVNPAPAGNDGSLEHPYTASEARALALNGDTGSYYISGIVTKIQNQYSASYGTANFWIDENGASDSVFEGYKIKYFGNQSWVEGNAQIALNDEVIIYGTLTVYDSTTPETSSGYLVSLNDTTKGLTLAAPTVTTNTANSAKEITVSWTAATGTESAVSYVITCGGQTYNATAAGSHSFTMSDYGTYSVSVAASASDAISATVTTSATLVDPNAGAPTVYEIQWGSAYNGSSVSSYTASWNATKDGFTVNMANWNNNNNGWDYVKCGRKNTASVATIITDSAISEAIRTVTITIDALTAANINSITLYVSDSKTSGWASAGTFTKATGDQSVTIASPAANKYYKLEFDCASGSSNGLLTLSKAQFSTN